MNRSVISLACAACSVIAFSSAAVSADLPPQARAEVSLPLKFDTSAVPLREMYDRAPPRVARGGRDFEPGKPLPIGNANAPVVDPLAANGVGASLAGLLLLPGADGTGVDITAKVAPPDTTGDIGPRHYVQWVNLRFAIYNVTRDANNQITGFNLSGSPKNGNTIWQGFGGPCETSNDGDPLVQYDQLANRWVLTQFAVSAAPYTQCVAVSTTDDPTGTYNRYSYSYGTDFNDYPHMGVWPNGYYITYNMFKRGRTFVGNKVCAFERDKMLAGTAARQVCAQTSNSYASLLPSDLEGTALPPAGTGSANPLLSISSTSLLAWRFAVNWTAGTGTLTGPTTVPVATFARACSGGTCIPQAGTTNKLDSLADRLMYRLSYRNNGGTESLVVNHSVTSNSSTGIRWYELRNAPGQTLGTSAPTVYQQGTYAPSADYRWMGSAAMDKSGGILIGYNASSATISPGIRYAARAATDPLGSLGAEQAILAGPGSQTGTLTRWGDYSTIALDPVDGCTMVFTTEYIPANGSFNWATYIQSMKLSTCQ